MNRSKPRIAVFLDLENLGFGNVNPVVLQGHLAKLAEHATLVSQVGCVNWHRRNYIAFRFPGVRLFTHGGGPDAADYELLKRIRTDTPASCDTVIIGSGDGIFTGIVNELRARGLRVEVIARTGSISGRLYRAVDECHLIDDSISMSA